MVSNSFICIYEKSWQVKTKKTILIDIIFLVKLDRPFRKHHRFQFAHCWVRILVFVYVCEWLITCGHHTQSGILLGLLTPFSIGYKLILDNCVCVHWLWSVECSTMAQETWVQSHVELYRRLKKWYLIPPCLTLSIIRYRSRVKWSNLWKGIASSPTPRCNS